MISKNSRITKVTAFLLSLALIVGTVPSSFLTAFASPAESRMGQLSSISEGGTIANANGEEVVATFGSETMVLNWSPADSSIGRMQDGWWIGVKMTAPVGMTTESDFADVTYKRLDGEVWSESKIFWNAQDSDINVEDTERYITLWGKIDEQILNDSLTDKDSEDTIDYSWKFDWDGNGEFEQLVTLKIVPDNIELTKDGNKVYPITDGNGIVSTFSDGLVVQGANNANVVKVVYETKQTLDWVKADTSIGRVSDGWWAGVKVAAPTDLMTESDFTDVTYQSLGSAGWSEAKPFWRHKDSADTASEHFIGLWGLLNETYLASAEENNKPLHYKWRFDWNKDEIYEQIVVLEISPEKITLNNADGYQVYPVLGTVNSITDGTVTGSGTENTVVKVSGASLNWSPKDESIGRMQDGWWVGIKVTAPSNMTAEDLENAFYNRTIHGTGTTTKVLFEDVKDSDRHVEIWTCLNRTLLEKYNNTEIVNTYVFDWNGDNTDDQTVTVSIDCDTITLNRVECTDFTFADVATDKKVWVGDKTYQNIASSKLSSGTVTYEIDDSSTAGAATVDSSTGEITLHGVGTVKVNATIAQDDVYDTATASFTFEIVKKKPTGFKITQPADITYGDNNNVFENKAEDGEGGGTIEYAIVSQTDLEGKEVNESIAVIDKNTGRLTIERSGKVQVNATRIEDDKYEAIVASYTLTINKAEQQGFNFTTDTPTELTYSTTPYDTVKVEGGEVNTDDIVYTITAGTDVAEIVNGNKVHTLKSGDFTLSVTKVGDACYNSVTVTREMKVNLAPQTTFKFEEAAPGNITYNENGNVYENKAIGGESNGAITYEIVMGDAVKIEDTSSPVLTILKAGEVTVKATKAADDKYQEATAQYTITIDLAKQAFTFAGGAEILKFYGIKEYMNAPVPTVDESKADGIGHGTGDFVYTIENNNIGATIPDDKTGKVVFGDSTGKVGTVTVNVTRLADEKYAECKNSYTITVEYTDVPSQAYSIDKEINSNGWYKHDITISAPDGYLISYNNELSTDDWAESVRFSDENVEIKSVALKNIAKGDITPKIPITGKIDKTEPTNLSIEYKTPLWVKIAEVMFGFDAESVDVTFKAEDTYSGIDFIEFSLDGGNTWEEKITDFSGEYTHTIDVQYRDSIALKVTDKAGNVSKLEHDEVVVVDQVTPAISFDYDYHEGLHQEVDNIIYANDKVTVTINLTAANFDLSEKPIVEVNGEAKTLNWDTNANSNVATFDLDKTGDYVIKAQFTDRLGRKTETVKEIHVDMETPELYDFAFEAGEVKGTNNSRDYYDEAQIVTAVIKEHNFRASDVVLTVTADQVTVDCDKYKEDFAVSSAWTKTAKDEWTAKIPFTKDANYTLNLTYTDLAGNSKTTDTIAFTVDTTAPAQPKIQYNKTWFASVVEGVTFGFFKAPIEVTVTSSDLVAGVKEIAYGYVGTKGEYIADSVEVAETKSATDGSITFEIPKDTEFKGIVSATAYDWSMNDSSVQNVAYDASSNEVGGIVVDNISPKVNVKFEGSLKDQIDVDTDSSITRQKKTTTDKDTRFVYDGAITATITVKEANFYEDMEITVYRDGIEVAASEYAITGWETTSELDVFVNTLTFSKDGDYQLELNYKDKSENAMKYDASGEYDGKAETNETYVSNIHTIDTVIPECEITCDNSALIQTINGREYYNTNRTATITVVDRNFRPNEVDFTVVAKNVKQEDVAFTYSDLTSWSDWKQDVTDKNKWIATVPFTTDANYTVDFTYTDIAEHENNDQKLITVDKVEPKNLDISYEPTFVGRIIEGITFGFYKAPVKVTITATDETSGVDHFVYSYKKAADASEIDKELTEQVIDYSTKEHTATVSFVIPKDALTKDNQFNGNVSFKAYDRSNNVEDTEDTKRVVVDSVSPEISVSYAAKDTATKVQFVDGNTNTVSNFENATQAFYNGAVSSTITINEANFFEGKQSPDSENGIVHEVGILLTKTDNNGVTTKTEYLPKGSAQRFATVATDVKYFTWTSDKDINTFTIDYVDDADYILTVEYTDFSTNDSNIVANDGQTVTKTYESKIVTVDNINPEVKVEYSNQDVINKVDGRDYLNAHQVATVTVTEHNFRADDVDVDVIAQNIIGEDVAVTDFDAQLRDRNYWKHYDVNGQEVTDAVDGDVHVATITYDVDANYTFDIKYTDLALREYDSYEADYFTVDTTAPTNLKASYSTSILQKVIESITFGYYDAQMTVTIQADDETAGIYHYKYSYLKSQNVSNVNAELINQAIDNAKITREGKTSTATFHIPERVLQSDNQFNGTIEFTAYDRSENSTEKKDNVRVVVDNITPTAQVTYNEPVKNANGISYYAGDINGTVVINEANFYSEDVQVVVTRDGNVVPVSVAWVDNSVDQHTGKFTLHDDGDYIVTINYTDRSSNKMATYTSNELTIDTKQPSISVSNIKMNSANKDETYGFTITANDINFDASTFKPVLTVVVKGEDGSYTTKTISLGDMAGSQDGQTYSYTVQNLEEDGIYTLTCAVKDMSDNAYADIRLDDGREYEAVQFSINRKGSTFAVNEYTDEVINQYYIYSVDKDIVLVEINADPITDYSVIVNGKALGSSEFTTTMTGGDNEWYKRTYSIPKELFEKEGEYNIVVRSTDKAKTEAYSDVKNIKVAFVVDQTAPILTISGLEAEGRYQTNEQTVTVIPTDDGGRLYSFKAIVYDNDGNPLKDKNGKDISVRFEMEGEELLKYLEEHDGKITFTVPEGYQNNVQIICTDCAKNSEGITNAFNETFDKVTVSASQIVIFYANKPLFYGTVAGLLAIIGGILFIVYKKRKKEEK